MACLYGLDDPSRRQAYTSVHRQPPRPAVLTGPVRACGGGARGAGWGSVKGWALLDMDTHVQAVRHHTLVASQNWLSSGSGASVSHFPPLHLL